MGDNIKLFFIVWGVILATNQVFIFHGCFKPDCLGAALPHTGIISWLIFYYMRKEDGETPKKQVHKKINKQPNNKFTTNDKDKDKEKQQLAQKKKKQQLAQKKKKQQLAQKKKKQQLAQKKKKQQLAIKHGWTNKFQHKITKINYPKFTFDIKGWSTDKVYFLKTERKEYINLHTGDRYDKAGLDYFGKKKISIEEEKRELALQNGWNEDFQHKKTYVHYPEFEFNAGNWSKKQVYLPSTNRDEYISLHTGDKYNRFGFDFHGNKKSVKEKGKQKLALKKNKQKLAVKHGWNDQFKHNTTKVIYPKFEFDIEGWSTDKVYFPKTKRKEYINLYTGDKYNKANIDHSGKKKPTKAVKKSTTRSKQKRKLPANEADKIYAKYIGKNLEDKGEIVIYAGLILGNKNQGIDLVSISPESKIIKLIQCNNFQHPIRKMDIKEVHKKISTYKIEFLKFKFLEINKYSHKNYSASKLKKLFEDIANSLDNYTIRKVFYISNDKITDITIWKDISMIKPNIFRYKDMKIVMHQFQRE